MWRRLLPAVAPHRLSVRCMGAAAAPPPATKHVDFGGRVLVVGLGSIGLGTVPLILKHVNMPAESITVLTADDRAREAVEVSQRYGIKHRIEALTPANYSTVLGELVQPGDFVLNLSVDVSSVDVMSFCAERDALYLDTVVEPWAGAYTDPTLTPSQRSNYAMREQMLALKRKLGPDSPTAVVTHGANPGMVNHMVKRALLNIARDCNVPHKTPSTRAGWGELASSLGIKAIHIAERDTQVSSIPKAVDEFVNTWSIDGFVGEGCQPAELGWGTHETHFPTEGERHTHGEQSAIFLNRPGASVRVRTWTPMEGPFHGFLITHNEAISLSDYFTLRDPDGDVKYRPTVHYAYHPCDDAVLSIHELAGKNWKMQSRQRLMVDDVLRGVDELGVLLMGHPKGAYWYGSQLSIDDARNMVEYNNATSLQVTSAALAGMIWAMRNPRCVFSPRIPLLSVNGSVRPRTEMLHPLRATPAHSACTWPAAASLSRRRWISTRFSRSCTHTFLPWSGSTLRGRRCKTAPSSSLKTSIVMTHGSLRTFM
eukprot:m.131449 g.131449  ORF g.131449 m.131449 type:complete len:539 (+) comp9812_c1_seq1:1907-3523(+)